MNEEIKRILKLVEEGKINSDQASELIDALKQNITQVEEKKSNGKYLKVNITSAEGKNINVKLPLKFVKSVIKATGKLPMKIQGSEEIDLQLVAEAIENEVDGNIVELNTNSGEHIEVTIE
jgi:ABC-type Fe3+-hydroxamate transport system substrate-binding protein